MHALCGKQVLYVHMLIAEIDSFKFNYCHFLTFTSFFLDLLISSEEASKTLEIVNLTFILMMNWDKCEGLLSNLSDYLIDLRRVQERHVYSISPGHIYIVWLRWILPGWWVYDSLSWIYDEAITNFTIFKAWLCGWTHKLSMYPSYRHAVSELKTCHSTAYSCLMLGRCCAARDRGLFSGLCQESANNFFVGHIYGYRAQWSICCVGAVSVEYVSMIFIRMIFIYFRIAE